jgi:hypothetical protein
VKLGMEDMTVVTQKKILNIALVSFTAGVALGMALIMSTPRSLADIVAGSFLFALMILAVLRVVAFERR